MSDTPTPETQIVNVSVDDASYPKEYTDAGNADAIAAVLYGRIAYTPLLGWLTWNQCNWEPNETAVKYRFLEYTRQMYEWAGIEYGAARADWDQLSKDSSVPKDTVDKLKKEVERKKAFFVHATKSRSTRSINAAMELTAALVAKKADDFDANPFEFNTKGGIVDLKRGTIRAHDGDSPFKWMTHLAGADPHTMSPGGKDLWESFLNRVCCGDSAFQEYLQIIIGSSLVGKVYVEHLFIAHGDGANGKSTLFNAIFSILGTYSQKIDPDALTTHKSNLGPTLATLRGKRFVLASELEKNRRLSTSALKLMCSSDPISVEAKYCAPEDIIPTHSQGNSIYYPIISISFFKGKGLLQTDRICYTQFR